MGVKNVPLHEPPAGDWKVARTRRQESPRYPWRFLVPVHARKRKEAPHEPGMRSTERGVRNGMAATGTTALTPALSPKERGNRSPSFGMGEPAAVRPGHDAPEKRSRPVGTALHDASAMGKRFMVPMDTRKRKEAPHEPEECGVRSAERGMEWLLRERPLCPSPLPSDGSGEGKASWAEWLLERLAACDRFRGSRRE